MELQGPYWPHSQGETWTLKGSSVALKGPQEHPKLPSIHIKNEVTQFTPPAASSVKTPKWNCKANTQQILKL